MKKSKTRKIKLIQRIISSVLAVMLITGNVSFDSLQVKAESAPGNIELSREVATEGMVLLENKNDALPIASDETVALFGKTQIDFVKGGGGSGDVTVSYVRNLLQGMQMKENDKKVKIYKPLADEYTQWRNNGNKNEMPLTNDKVKEVAKNSGTAVVAIGRYSNEGSDRSASKGDYYLSNDEIKMLQQVNDAGFDKFIVVLNVGGIVDTSWVDDYDKLDSVLLAWQPGMEGGLAVADILVGDVNPSGKLTDTFAKDFMDYPTSETFLEDQQYVRYTEDIFVGYRWFETFDPDYEKVNYEFGYGLSYTTFDINVKEVDDSDGTIDVTVDVTNTGDTAGKEVVQLYYRAPQGVLGKPAMELAGFAKTGLLEKGETETLTITFNIDDMASYDDTGKQQKSAYILEEGDYEIFVGNSVRNAKENGAVHTLHMDYQIVEQLTEELKPKQLDKRLLADGSYENLDMYEGWGIPVYADGRYTEIQAEDFTKKHVHAIMDFNDDSSICGMKIYTSDTGTNRWLTYVLDVEEAGSYDLTLGVSNTKNTFANGLAVYVEDLSAPIKPVSIPGTGGKWNIQETSPATIELPEGKSVLKIEFTLHNAWDDIFDYFKLVKSDNPIPEEPGPYHQVTAQETTKIEAEDFSTKHSVVDIESINAGDDKGGTSLKNLHTAGYWVNYGLEVAEAGTYKITMRSANGLGDIVNGANAYVGWTKQNNFRLDLPYTGVSGNQWFNFIDLETGTINLPEGKCVLKFIVNSQMGNLNYFTLEKLPENSTQRATSEMSDTSAAKRTTASVRAGRRIMFREVAEDVTLMDEFVSQLSDYEVANLLGGQSTVLPGGTGSIGNSLKYGIPATETVDGPAGIRLNVSCTAWPCSTLLACTWDVALIERLGKAVGVEAAENGADIWLAPGMNIHRNPLCGRNFEYYSEDPVVTGKIAAAITKGVQSQNVGITVKHFIANNKETARNNSDSRISERAIREIYLKGFEIAIKEADPWCVMSTYNSINGVETSESYALLTTILRDEWGFDGLVMSDWWNDSTQYRETLAGNDLKMADGKPNHLVSALKAGFITREDMEICAKRVLNLILKSNAMNRLIPEPVVHNITGSEISRVKAVEWVEKSSGIGTESCEDEDGGLNTTGTYEDRFISYYVDVEKTGLYEVKSRLATVSGSAEMKLFIDDQEIGLIKTSHNSGGWQKWFTTEGAAVEIPAGQHEFKVLFVSGSLNVNWFDFALLEERADKKELEELIASVDNLTKEEYTSDSWQKLEEELKEAQDVMELAAASQTMVDDSKAALQTAIDGLEKKPVPPVVDGLKNSIAKAEKEVIPNKDIYTTESYSKFADALNAAKKVLLDANSAQEAVNQAEKDLLAAISSLQRKPVQPSGDEKPTQQELLDLQTQINRSGNYKKENYDLKSWNEYTKVLADARKIYGDQNATKEQINAALISLKNAESKLQKIVKASKVTVTTIGLATNQKTTTIYTTKGKKVTIKGVVSPAKAAQGVTYTSKNKKIAKVSKSGVITGLKSGTTKIVITSKDKNKSKTITIKVQKKAEKVKSLSVTSKKKIALKRGKTTQIKTRVSPVKTTDRVTYKSGRTKVATVDKAGKITAKKKGTAKITVKCGSKSVEIKLTVK